MSDLWQEYWRFHRDWTAARDSERLRLFDVFYDAFSHRETEPERMLSTLSRARDDAQRLREPWWIEFFDIWRLSTLAYDLGDVRRAHPFAMEMMSRINAPSLREHSFRPYLLLVVLEIYTSSDPIGHLDEIERGFAHLEVAISTGPVEHRHLMQCQRLVFLQSLDRFKESCVEGQQALALVDRNRNPRTRAWYVSWLNYQLCRSRSELGHFDRIAAHAEHTLSVTNQSDNLRRIEADAYCWLAVAARFAGNEREASRHLHKGLALLPELAGREVYCADSIAKHHDLCEDWPAALGVRDRQRFHLENQGQIHNVCEIDVERCRLLAKMKRLTDADRDAALRSFARLRFPERFATKLATIENA